MFVIKPTDHNGFFFCFLSAIPLALNAVEMYFCVKLGSEKDLTFFFTFVFLSQALISCTTYVRWHVKQLRLLIGKAVVRGNGTIYSASLVVEVM